MSTLEDKILGGPKESYCSSSDEEVERNFSPRKELVMKDVTGSTQQTGPKGVIEDFKEYEKFKKAEKDKKQKELYESVQKSAFTVLPHSIEKQLDQKCREIDEQVQNEMDEDDKEFFEYYRQKKMQEMLSKLQKLPVFGSLIKIQNGEDYIRNVDQEDTNVLVIIYIYNELNSDPKLYQMMENFSKMYPYIKFCAAPTQIPGISKNFSSNGVPALLIYKGGELLTHFVKLHEYLKRNFTFKDLEQFLCEKGIISSAQLSPGIVN